MEGEIDYWVKVLGGWGSLQYNSFVCVVGVVWVSYESEFLVAVFMGTE